MIPGVLTALALGALAAAHPMHTSVTELTYDARAGRTRLALRVFADDFGTAALPGDSGAFAYVRRTVRLEIAGRAVPLHPRAFRRDGEALHIELEAATPRGLAGARLAITTLHERFADQVNLARVRSSGRIASLLFTRGDGPKRLP